MKKLFAALAIVLFACTLQAQVSDPLTLEKDIKTYGDFIFDDIAERTGGYSYIEPMFDMGNWSYVTIISLPSYYDFDLVRLDVRNFRNSYGDVSLLQGWRPYEDGHTYIMMIENKYSLMFYYVDTGVLMVSLMYSP